MPEHTIEAYRLALEQGADALETDIVLTRDGVLVCRHECELSVTTDVVFRPEFAGRKTIKCIDGETAEGWFVEDFTLAEIRTLRARQRFDFRDRSFDGKFGIVTLAELLDLVATLKTKSGQRPGLLIEIKHAAYFDSIGLNMADTICRAISGNGGDASRRVGVLAHHLSPPSDENGGRVPPPYKTDPATSKGTVAPGNMEPAIWIECFEIDVLQRLRQRISTPIIQLLDAAHMQPADVAAAGGSTTFGDMITQAGLGRIASYATGIGAWKELIIPHAPTNPTKASAIPHIGPHPSSLIADAHALGLCVHAWTFRNEPRFLAREYEDEPTQEYRRFGALGLDGFITDFPDCAAAIFHG
jgi:glycerophosphoryl diester phosphodiesterase